MTTIDDLFKSHNGTKRKFENPVEADPSQAYKSAKLQDHTGVKRTAQVDDDDEDDDENEAGPSLPPDFEEPGDDDEGRFFGGGLDENAKDAMDFLDAQDGEDAIKDEKYDAAWVRRVARDFEKKVAKNASLRAKYENDPAKFMDSEADVDDGVKDLSILSEHAHLYDEFAKSTAAAKLVELLAHENTDIAIGAIEIISELTDEDVAAEQDQWDALVAAFLEADLLSLLVSNFSRFDESDPTDASGVYHSLSVIENLLSQPANTDAIGSEKALLTWLLARIQRPETPTTQNKQYASEILSILTQSSRANRLLITAANGVDILLTNLAPYRRADPEKDSNEEEYMENLFDILTALVEEPAGKTEFLTAEGTQLCLLLVRDGKTAKDRALKVLDAACAEPADASNADTASASADSADTASASASAEPPHITLASTLITARGLKPLFTTLMKTRRPSPSQTEHLLSLLTSLLRSLPGNSDARFRLLAKFLETDYAKVAKLVALRREYAARLAAFDAARARDDDDDDDDGAVASRLAEGLYALQRIDVILAWLVAEDKGAKRAISAALAETGDDLATVRSTLLGMLSGVMAVETAEREVLDALVGFLQ